jgi:NAD(P)-dependent dehydrogenase (short-subunit alcohol dehydrogenase family)
LIVSNKICLITGSSGGIGRELVRVFIDVGYKVIGIDNNSQTAGHECSHFIKADLEKFVLDETYSNEVLNNLQDFIGESPINVLINNAAIQTLGDLQTAKIAEWQNSLNINLLAPFMLSQKLATKLKGGSIVNISSIHARMTKKNFLVYSTTKAALSGLTRALAIDLAGRVRVNAVEPAAIYTEMLEAGFSANPSFMDELIKSHPVGKIGNPHELAKFVLFIADSGDVFVSGSIIPYDGCVGITLPN